VYEGRVYFGSNDGNIYCLEEYPVTTGQILAELEKNEVEVNTTVTGCGQLPGVAYAPINVTFVKSDGGVDSIQVTAQNDGAFSFDYTPDVVGEVKVSIHCSGAMFIMQDAKLQFNAVEPQQTTEPDQQPDDQDQTKDSGIPTEVVVAVVALVVVAVVVVAYLFVKKRDRSSPVVISD
jgi:hypothetical protein